MQIPALLGWGAGSNQATITFHSPDQQELLIYLHNQIRQTPSLVFTVYFSVFWEHNYCVILQFVLSIEKAANDTNQSEVE